MYFPPTMPKLGDDPGKDMMMAQFSRALSLESLAVDLSGRLASDFGSHAVGSSFFERTSSIAREHRSAVEAALQRRGGASPSSGTVPSRGTSTDAADGPGSSLGPLTALHGLLAETVSTYLMAHVMAHRVFDSDGEGNAAQLAETLMKDELQTLRELSFLTSELTIWSTTQSGAECHCECPGCGLGMCLCSPHGVNTLEELVQETGPVPVGRDKRGIGVRKPRQGSPAERAGLRTGDRIRGVDSVEVVDEADESVGIVQAGVYGHASGEEVRIRREKPDGTVDDIVIKKP